MSASLFITLDENPASLSQSYIVRCGGVVVGNIVHCSVADEFSVYLETSGTTELVDYGAKYLGDAYTLMQAKMLLVKALREDA